MIKLSSGAKTTEFIVTLLSLVLLVVTKLEVATVGAITLITISFIWSRTNVKQATDVKKIDNITIKRG